MGDSGTILHWDGNQWSRQSATADVSSKILQKIHGSSETDVRIVGAVSPGVILRWNGSNWDLEVGSLSPSLYGIWSFDSKTAFAAADQNVYSWNGSTWTPQAVSLITMAGVWGSGPFDVWAVGYTGNPPKGVIRHWNGSTWSQFFP